MPQTEYIGERYVPIFASPSEVWNSDLSYDPLTIVRWETPDGDSALYVSKTYVPPNVSVWNTRYWSKWSGDVGPEGPVGPRGPQGLPGTDAKGITYEIIEDYASPILDSSSPVTQRDFRVRPLTANSVSATYPMIYLYGVFHQTSGVNTHFQICEINPKLASLNGQSSKFTPYLYAGLQITTGTSPIELTMTNLTVACNYVEDDPSKVTPAVSLNYQLTRELTGSETITFHCVVSDLTLTSVN